MGFIEIAAVNSSEELFGIWSDFFDMSKSAESGKIYDVQIKVTDGMRFFLKNGQSLIMVSENKISDYVTGAGAFVFHNVFEPYKYTGKSGDRYNELYAEYPDKFGSHSENAVCYLANTKNQIKLPFEFSEATYYDKNYGFDIRLQGSGYFEMGAPDALSCFIKSDLDCEKFAQANTFDISDDEAGSLSASFEILFKSSLAAMRESDIGYDRLAYGTGKIASLINADPQRTQYLQNGAEISNIEFTSIFPDETSIMEIVKFRRGNNG